jgi:hypothetical protein
MKKKLLIAFSLTFLSAGAFALTVLQLNLNQLTALSEKVFVGKCVEVRPVSGVQGRNVEQVTFEVKEMLKGTPTSRVTFKQLSDSGKPFKRNGMMVQTLPLGLPRYKVGQEAVIFLSHNDPTSGLTAPIGLFQGKFDVLTTDTGLKIVRNGINNQGLFVGMKTMNKNSALKTNSEIALEQKILKNPKEIPLDDFSSLVKKLAQ